MRQSGEISAPKVGEKGRTARRRDRKSANLHLPETRMVWDDAGKFFKKLSKPER
jgi:hypothetical protein